jgi:hypothetical protein
VLPNKRKRFLPMYLYKRSILPAYHWISEKVSNTIQRSFLYLCPTPCCFDGNRSQRQGKMIILPSGASKLHFSSSPPA